MLTADTKHNTKRGGAFWTTRRSNADPGWIGHAVKGVHEVDGGATATEQSAR